MGSCCSCCFDKDNENNEYSPIETHEILQSRTKQPERNVPNYQSILDQASSGFLPSKPRYKNDSNMSNENIEIIKSKFNNVVVSPSMAKSPPVDLSNIKAKNGKYDESTMLNNLSKPSNTGRTVLSVAEDIGQIVSRNRSLNVSEESYPLVSFNPVDR